MKRLFLTLVGVLSLTLLSFACTDGTAQEVKPTEAPLLWKIEAEGLKTSYLFGTIHLPDPRVVTLHPEVQEALDGADAVYTELKMDKVAQLRSTERMLLPADTGLKKLLPADLYGRVDGYLKQRGLNLAALDRLQIWAVEAQLALLENPSLLGGEALDMRLYAVAKSADKEVGGIETYDEQFAVFEAFTTEEQIESLSDSLDDLEEAAKEGRSMLEELTTLYLKGDEKALLDFMYDEVDPDNPREVKFMKLLLTDRNVLMAERSAAKMREHPERGYFFAYGAAHMPGEGGVVQLLREQGFQVTRLHPPAE